MAHAPPDDDAEAVTLDELDQSAAALPRRMRLDTVLSTRRLKVRILREVFEGRLSALEGNRRIRIVESVDASNQVLSFEKRLRALEKASEAPRPRR